MNYGYKLDGNTHYKVPYKIADLSMSIKSGTLRLVLSIQTPESTWIYVTDNGIMPLVQLVWAAGVANITTDHQGRSPWILRKPLCK